MKSGKSPSCIPERDPDAVRAGAGFTLLEVVAALAILMLFLVPVLGAVTQGLRNVEHVRSRSLALRLAQDKMTEIEMMPIPEYEGEDRGDFDREYPGYRWEQENIKSPDIQLMEEYIVGLKGMEIHVTVFWLEGEDEKSVKLSTIILE